MLDARLTEKNGRAQNEARWQNHTVKALWVLLALLFGLTFVLFYWKTHGLFEGIPQDASPAWPDNWP